MKVAVLGAGAMGTGIGQRSGKAGAGRYGAGHRPASGQRSFFGQPGDAARIIVAVDC